MGQVPPLLGVVIYCLQGDLPCWDAWLLLMCRAMLCRAMVVLCHATPCHAVPCAPSWSSKAARTGDPALTQKSQG